MRTIFRLVTGCSALLLVSGCSWFSDRAPAPQTVIHMERTGDDFALVPGARVGTAQMGLPAQQGASLVVSPEHGRFYPEQHVDGGYGSAC
jgi:hypothetical protein